MSRADHTYLSNHDDKGHTHVPSMMPLSRVSKETLRKQKMERRRRRRRRRRRSRRRTTTTWGAGSFAVDCESVG